MTSPVGTTSSRSCWISRRSARSFSCSGDWRTYYEGGEPKSSGTYASDLREGHWITWHPNGERRQEVRERLPQRIGKQRAREAGFTMQRFQQFHLPLQTPDHVSELLTQSRRARGLTMRAREHRQVGVVGRQLFQFAAQLFHHWHKDIAARRPQHHDRTNLDTDRSQVFSP